MNADRGYRRTVQFRVLGPLEVDLGAAAGAPRVARNSEQC